MVITNSEGKVLLVKHNRERSWSLPGGRLNPGEDPKAGGLREVFEETSLHGLRTHSTVGRYEGKSTTHIVFSGESSKQPRIDLREIQSAVSGGTEPASSIWNPHVDGILKLVDQSEGRTQKERDALRSQLPLGRQKLAQPLRKIIDQEESDGELAPIIQLTQKWLRKSEQGDKWNRCLIEGMIVLSETGARDEQTTPP